MKKDIKKSLLDKVSEKVFEDFEPFNGYEFNLNTQSKFARRIAKDVIRIVKRDVKRRKKRLHTLTNP